MFWIIVGFVIAGAVGALAAKRDAQWRATMQALARPDGGEEVVERIRDIEKRQWNDRAATLRGVAIFAAAFVATFGVIAVGYLFS
jgi:hypothetical protein